MLLKFFVYSVFGCILEGIWCVVQTGQLKSRRMLVGLPMCPVYGVGGVAISTLLGSFRDNLLALYGFGAILASAVEFAFFMAGKLCFSVKLWDYSDKPCSFKEGVCGEYTVWWGLAAVIFVKYLDPLTENVLLALNPYTRLIVTVFLCIVTFSDIIKTVNILKAFKRGTLEKLPDYFWYMQKI